MWYCRRSPSPPVTVISGVAARILGPGMRPASISLRVAMSSRAFAEEPLTEAVKPASSIAFTLCMVRNTCSSTGSSPVE